MRLHKHQWYGEGAAPLRQHLCQTSGSRSCMAESSPNLWNTCRACLSEASGEALVCLLARNLSLMHAASVLRRLFLYFQSEAKGMVQSCGACLSILQDLWN